MIHLNNLAALKNGACLRLSFLQAVFTEATDIDPSSAPGFKLANSQDQLSAFMISCEECAAETETVQLLSGNLRHILDKLRGELLHCFRV